MTKQIHFLFSRRLDGYVFNPHRPEGLRFTDVAKGVDIQVHSEGEEGDFGYGHSSLAIRAKLSYDATERQIGFVDTLLNERTVKPDETPMVLPYSAGRKEMVSSEGKIAKGYSPTSDFLPRRLQKLCISAGEELEKHVVRFIRLLRWLEKASGPVMVREDRDPRFGLYWKTTQASYRSVPWPRQGPFTHNGDGFGGLTWSEEDQHAFGQLWGAENEHEPLGHQLLREAIGIATHNSRSALLICYSALEVGIKQHISKCAPDASWLAKYAPAPPLFNILRDYLPQLHNDNPAFEKWEAIKPELSLVAKFVEDRNRLAHRGEEISGSLDNYLRVTGDLLYAFDVFEGHTWAKSCVSSQFGALLGWKSTRGSLKSVVHIIQ